MEFNKDDLMDMASALYWYCNDYHSGQWSDLYSVLCQISDVYKPGMSENGVEPESLAADYYSDLENGTDAQEMLDYILNNVGE